MPTHANKKSSITTTGLVDLEVKIGAKRRTYTHITWFRTTEFDSAAYNAPSLWEILYQLSPLCYFVIDLCECSLCRTYFFRQLYLHG
jgi:hypothetical protein